VHTVLKRSISIIEIFIHHQLSHLHNLWLFPLSGQLSVLSCSKSYCIERKREHLQFFQGGNIVVVVFGGMLLKATNKQRHYTDASRDSKNKM